MVSADGGMIIIMHDCRMENIIQSHERIVKDFETRGVPKNVVLKGKEATTITRQT